MSDLDSPTAAVEQKQEESEETPKKRRGRGSSVQKANDESQAILKEMGFNDAETPGRRRTRAATRGEVYTPPPKRQRRSAGSTPPSSGGRGRKKANITPEEVDEPMEVTETTSSDKVEETPTMEEKPKIVEDEEMLEETATKEQTPEKKIVVEPPTMEEEPEKCVEEPTVTKASVKEHKTENVDLEKTTEQERKVDQKKCESSQKTDSVTLPVEEKKSKVTIPQEESKSKATIAQEENKPLDEEPSTDFDSLPKTCKETTSPVLPVSATANAKISDNGLEDECAKLTSNDSTVKQCDDKLTEGFCNVKPIPIPVAQMKSSSIFSNSSHSTLDSSNVSECKPSSDNVSHTSSIVE